LLPGKRKLKPGSKVLVVLKTFLGDAVMATPLLDGLLEQSMQVTIATSPMIHSLLNAPERPLGFLEMSRSRKFADTVRLSRMIRREKFEAAILVNRSIRSALAARLSGIKIRSGHATDNRGFLLTHKLAYDLLMNEAESYLDLSRIAGLELPFREQVLYVSAEEREEGAKLVESGSVAVQVGASFVGKKIPIPLLKELVETLHKNGLKIALIGGKDEIESTNELLAVTQTPMTNLVGKTSIRGTMGALANIRVAVSGDTGLCHVAAGVGCPTLVIFSGQPESKWGHDYSPHKFFTAPEGNMENLSLAIIMEPLQAMLTGLP